MTGCFAHGARDESCQRAITCRMDAARRLSIAPSYRRDRLPGETARLCVTACLKPTMESHRICHAGHRDRSGVHSGENAPRSDARRQRTRMRHSRPASAEARRFARDDPSRIRAAIRGSPGRGSTAGEPLRPRNSAIERPHASRIVPGRRGQEGRLMPPVKRRPAFHTSGPMGAVKGMHSWRRDPDIDEQTGGNHPGDGGRDPSEAG